MNSPGFSVPPRPVSRVPADVSAYHEHLQAAFTLASELQADLPAGLPQQTQRLQALAHLWSAYDFYLEAHTLQLGIALLSPWPRLQHALQKLGHLLYPDQIFLSPSPTWPAVAAPEAEWPAELTPWLKVLAPETPPRLSVCMIVRNEAQSLPTALNSLADLADEIIVVDTGSEDGTQALAAAHPRVKLHHFGWIDDFAAARNASLEQASGDWVMILDADETLLPQSLGYLRDFFGFAPLGWQIYTCQINHALPDGMFFSWTTRIFRRDQAIRFVGAIHEMPRKFSWPHWLLQTAIPGILQHSGNLPEVYARQQKPLRARLLQAQVENPQTRNPFLAYHYAYLLVNGIDLPANPALAEQLLLQTLTEAQAYENRLPPAPEWVPVSVAAVALLLAQLWAQQQNHAGVVELYRRFAGTCRITAFPALGAISLMALGHLGEARIAWLRCFDPGLIPIKQNETWQQQALEGLMQIGLLQEDGFLALWAVRRLRERFPSGQVPGQTYDLIQIQRQLEDLLVLPQGTWLDRLEFEIHQALKRKEISVLAFYAMAYLCEAWDQTVLGDAVRALHHLRAPALATAVAGLARRLYPQDSLFQAFGSEHPPAGDLDLVQCQAPGGAYWLYLTRRPQVRPRVSVCMIVRNAADTLPATLQSLEPVVDEYVIAETGSADETPAIIAQWGQNHQVVSWYLPWTDDFAAARNAVFARASGDWILIVDADEILTPESVPRLHQLFAQAPAGLQMFAIRCASLYPDASLTSEDWVPRIYQNHPLIRYWGAVHNFPGHACDAERLPVIPFAGVKLLHSGFSPEMVQKHNKSQRLQRLEQITRVQDLPNPYFLYHLGYALIYQYDPPQLTRAFDLLELSRHETLRWHQRPPVPGWFAAPLRKVQLLLFRLLAHWQDDQELIRRYARDQGSACEEPEYHYWYAHACLRQGDYAAARAGFSRCLTSTDPGQPQAGFGSWKAWLGLSEVALLQGDWALGIEAFQALIAAPGPLDAQQLFSQWWEKQLTAASRQPLVP